MHAPDSQNPGEFIGKEDPQITQNNEGETVVVPNGWIMDAATGELRPAIASASKDLQGVGQEKLRALAYELAAQGVTPLEFLIKQMRESTNPLSVKLFCAEKAAPYIHKKMPTHIEARIEDNSGKTGAKEKLIELLNKKMTGQAEVREVRDDDSAD